VNDKLESISAAAVPGVTQTEIVCGDCAGPGFLPRLTLLTTSGVCAKCGGRSYALASKFYRQPEAPNVAQVDQANGLY